MTACRLAIALAVAFMLQVGVGSLRMMKKYQGQTTCYAIPPVVNNRFGLPTDSTDRTCCNFGETFATNKAKPSDIYNKAFQDKSCCGQCAAFNFHKGWAYCIDRKHCEHFDTGSFFQEQDGSISSAKEEEARPEETNERDAEESFSKDGEEVDKDELEEQAALAQVAANTTETARTECVGYRQPCSGSGSGNCCTPLMCYLPGEPSYKSYFCH